MGFGRLALEALIGGSRGCHLLLEGMENGTVEGHSVFSAGELANVGREQKDAPVADSGERKVAAGWDNSGQTN